MGAALYASEPAVRAVLDRCDALLREERGASLLDVMFGRPGAGGDLDDPQWKRPAIYALECALTALWSSVGIRPDVVFGHSLGEIAAAHTAGVFGLEDGLRFAAARGALIGALPGDGAMAAVFAPAPRVAAAVDEHNAASHSVGLSIATDNGAHQVVSGAAADVAALLERFEAEEVRVARLRKSRHAASEPDAFENCFGTLATLGVDVVVEVGPDAGLGTMVTAAWPEAVGNTGNAGHTAARPVLSSLGRSSDGEEAPAAGSRGGFVQAVAGAYEARITVSFAGLFAGEDRRRISLPDYPFERRRHWIKMQERQATALPR